jgi:RecA-family ATPase
MRKKFRPLKIESDGKSSAKMETATLKKPPDFNLNGSPMPEPIKDFLTVKPINEWIEEAKNLKIPAKLFGDFWFESEMVILFASAGVGKTLLAYQIAAGLTEGKKILIFEPELSAQTVLYCDFELSAKQVESRYSNNFLDHYKFSPNFYRVEINPESDIPDNVKFEEFIIQQVEKSLIQTGAKILIVDNITFFRDDQEKAKDALKLMKQLKSLKTRLGLSILVLAHTPKRDITRPITRNDISGSSMIVNFTDSAFAIGESANETGTRYLKQVKPGRFSSTIYDANKVMVCTIGNPSNFIQYEFFDFGREENHLKAFNQKVDRDAEIFKLHKAGMSLRDIAQKIGITHTAVDKILKNGISTEPI